MDTSLKTLSMWTRQGASGGGAVANFSVRLMAFESTVHHALAFVWLTIFVIFLAQV